MNVDTHGLTVQFHEHLLVLWTETPFPITNRIGKEFDVEKVSVIYRFDETDEMWKFSHAIAFGGDVRDSSRQARWTSGTPAEKIPDWLITLIGLHRPNHTPL
jgi:hypothetical protein